MLQHYREQPNADEAFIDKEWARLNFYRGCALEGMGRKDEAEEAYKTALTTQYAHTCEGQIEATNYLMAARRWSEAAEKFEMLEGVLIKYDMKMTLDNISTFLLPKFAANVGANRTDSAIAVGMWIKEVLDTAIVWERKDASIELATLYDIQQKENNFVAQNAALSHQRFLSAVITLIIVIVGFSLFIYFRHQASMRLESAYHDLEIANARAEESSRIKSEFIQQISHEIRTPLNILSGYSQILTTSDAQLDESTRQNVNQQITENANRITALINKMLELSDARSKTVIECTDKVTAMEIAADAVADSDIDNAFIRVTLTKPGAQFIHNVASHLGLGFLVVILAGLGRYDANLILVALETSAFVAQGVEYNEVQVLRFQFMLCILLFVVGFKSKANEHLPIVFHPSQFGSNVGIGHKMDVHGLPHPLYLLRCHFGRTEVGHGGTENGSIRLRESTDGSIVHLHGTFHVDSMNQLTIELTIDRTSNQRHLRPTTGTLLSKGKAHFAAGVVADEAHRVYLLVGRTSGYHDLLASQVTSYIFLLTQRILEILDNALRLFHAPLAFQSAGQEAALRLNDMITKRAQAIHVLLCSGMSIHVQVHGRCYEHRCLH